MLQHVNDYDGSLPKGKSSKAARKWSRLFVKDFVFNLTNEKDHNGNVKRKVDQHSKTGRAFKRIHEENVQTLLDENTSFSQNGPIPLPSIEAEYFDRAFFKYWKRKVAMPLVVKGYLNDAPILNLASKEMLIENNGEREVRCLSKKADNSSSLIGQNTGLVKTTLKEFLNDEKFEGYYINNFYGILSDDDFLEKCKGEEIDSIQGQKNIIAQWFISRSKNTGSTLHCAGGDNMFLNIQGRKEWYFIDRTYTPVLQPALSKYSIYSISELHEDLNSDFYQTIIGQYPFLKQVPIFKYVLEEGDMLYNPPFWWHRVCNKTDFTVGCATRYWATRSAPNSLAHTLCLFYDAFRHPTKSFIPSTIGMMANKNLKGKYVHNIFSKGEEDVDS